MSWYPDRLRHLNFDRLVHLFFDATSVPLCVAYVRQPGHDEPSLTMCGNCLRFFAKWLEHRGYISEAERRWLWEDLARQDEEYL